MDSEIKFRKIHEMVVNDPGGAMQFYIRLNHAAWFHYHSISQAYHACNDADSKRLEKRYRGRKRKHIDGKPGCLMTLENQMEGVLIQLNLHKTRLEQDNAELDAHSRALAAHSKRLESNTTTLASHIIGLGGGHHEQE